MKQRKNLHRRNNIIQLVYGLVIIIALSIISQYIYTRFDLTSEKRYTLSDATKKMLTDLDEYVFFKVYLEGEFPAGFKRLRNETKEMLNEFRAYSPYVEFEFVNPSASSDEKERNKVYQLLVEKGLQPTNLQVANKDGNSEQLIFPGALVNHLNKESAVDLLKTQLGMPHEEVLNNSIENLEFTLASVIRQLTVQSKAKIAFIEGHGELSSLETADIGNELSEIYSVSRVRLNEQLNSLTDFKSYDSSGRIIIKNKFDAIVVAKPDSAFSEKDKFIIDQYLMRGGKILWLVDPVYASMDSLQQSRNTLGFGMDLNLKDMFFKYGVRMNQELLLDLNARYIPIVTGMVGNQPQQEFLPWYYFPIIRPSTKHPIVNNMNSVMTDFPCTIDTVQSENARKTSLLASSEYTRISKAPALIDLKMMDINPKSQEYERFIRTFNMPRKMVAVLVEGRFKSLYANRMAPRIANNDSIGFRKESVETAQIFVSDGDIIRNQLHYSKGYPLPLGFDQYTREQFGNKDFILNALNYLIDQNGLISIRSREIKIRLLDRNRMTENMGLIKTLNVVVPILLIVVMGIMIQLRRKKKFTKKK